MRLVSLVPSLTETVWELGAQHHVVGVTKFCVEPPQAREGARVVGGTKDPDLAQIRALHPDLVLADEDENKPEHLREISTFSGVHVTRIESVPDAARELEEIGRLVGREHDAEARAQAILEEYRRLRELRQVFPPIPLFVPIWRTPLMTAGGRTYLSDLVEAAGGRNVYSDAPRKYFETRFEEVRPRAPEAVLLPTEPYRFREAHRHEFAQALGLSPARVRIVDGQDLTWFGTRTLRGLHTLAAAVAALREPPPGQEAPEA